MITVVNKPQGWYDCICHSCEMRFQLREAWPPPKQNLHLRQEDYARGYSWCNEFPVGSARNIRGRFAVFFDDDNDGDPFGCLVNYQRLVNQYNSDSPAWGRYQ